MKKYVYEQDINITNLSKKLRFFASNYSVFVLEKQPKNLNFFSFFISFLVALLRFCFRKTT